MPIQQSYLHQLRIPSNKFLEFIKVLILGHLKKLELFQETQVQAENKEFVKGLTEVSKCILDTFIGQDAGGHVTWEAFDMNIARDMVGPTYCVIQKKILTPDSTISSLASPKS